MHRYKNLQQNLIVLIFSFLICILYHSLCVYTESFEMFGNSNSNVKTNTKFKRFKMF